MSMISRYLEAEVSDPNLSYDLYAPGAFDRADPELEFEVLATVNDLLDAER